VELVDTTDSKSVASNSVAVRVRPPLPPEDFNTSLDLTNTFLNQTFKPKAQFSELMRLSEDDRLRRSV
jgi:hypothetical protein